MARILKGLGKLLEDYRKHTGVTQANAAEKLGLSLRFYQALEGDEQDPGLETVCKIIQELKISPNALFGFEKPALSPTIKHLTAAISELEKELNTRQNTRRTVLTTEEYMLAWGGMSPKQRKQILDSKLLPLFAAASESRQTQVLNLLQPPAKAAKQKA